MKRILALAVLGLLMGGATQEPVRAPSGPLSLVQIGVPSGGESGFAEIGGKSLDAGIARIWILDIYATDHALNKGMVSGLWTEMAIDCADHSSRPIGAAVVLPDGEIQGEQILSGQPSSKIGPTTPFEVVRIIACEGRTPTTVMHYSNVEEAVVAFRTKL